MERNLDAFHGRAFDLTIIGGGITGAGVALDASLRGLRVALIDKGDFASGTSSVSSKLIHGGLRYLEHGHLSLVHEAMSERRRLLRNAPHLVRPLRFVLPFQATSRVPPWKWRVGLLLYDLLAGRDNLHRSKALSLRQMRQAHPGLITPHLTGGGCYFDAWMDDARLCLAVLHSAVAHGAVIANHVECVGIQRGEVLAVDRLTGRAMRLETAEILNAAGPWAGTVRRLAGEEGELLAPTRGVHLVTAGRQSSAALLFLHPDDGRVFFVIPWLGKTLIGTTDTDSTGTPDSLQATEEEIAYLLRGYNQHLAPALSRGEVLNSFIGVRPLLRANPAEPSARSREYRIIEGHTGLITVVGGKYTTYRAMAEAIVDRIVGRLGKRSRCHTRTFRLHGAPRGDWKMARRELTVRCQRLGASPETAIHLVDRYGTEAPVIAGLIQTNPELGQAVVASEPDVRAEFVYHRDHEMACREEDSLLRRTRLGLFHPELMPK